MLDSPWLPETGRLGVVRRAYLALDVEILQLSGREQGASGDVEQTHQRTRRQLRMRDPQAWKRLQVHHQKVERIIVLGTMLWHMTGRLSGSSVPSRVCRTAFQFHRMPMHVRARVNSLLTAHSITAWVHTLDEEDEGILSTADIEPPASPSNVRIAHHNHLPTSTFWGSNSQRGRLHDHQRDSTPPLPRGTVLDTSSRWRGFATSSMYPRSSLDLDGERVSEEWFARNAADYSQPWLEGNNEGDEEKGASTVFKSRKKRRAWYLRFQRTILRSPIVPVVIRMIVFGFAMTALGLAGDIHHLTKRDLYHSSTPSTKMAIIVDAIALAYLLYITYDEYSGKPLGLRSAKAKMRLIFLDLFFIVFASANLSLAFQAVGDEDGCGLVCTRQEALAGVLLVVLVAWLLTFSISVMRSVFKRNTTRNRRISNML